MLDRYKTGLDLLDVISGGGFFNGRAYELSGPKSSGKTSGLIAAQAAMQRDHEGIVVHAESESSIDLDRAELMGFERNNAIIPDFSIAVLEEGFEWLKNNLLKIKATYPDAPVGLSWDTIAATITRDQFNSGGGDKHNKEVDMFAGGRQQNARVIKFKLNEFIPILSKYTSYCLFLNQVFDSGNMYGDPYETPGGNALHHHMTMRLRYVRAGKILDGNGWPIGIKTRIKTIKNKQAPEGLELTSYLFFDSGFSNELTLFYWCQEHKIIQVSANGWCSGNKPYGIESSFRTSQLGLKGELIKETPFYYWMLENAYKFMAHKYKSLEKRYQGYIEDTHKLGMASIEALGGKAHHPAGSIKEVEFKIEEG